MKNWFKHITILFAGAALLATSCDEGDAVIDQVTAETSRGAVLRTTSLISNELPIGDDSAGFSVELEIQDKEDGALVDQVDVYVGFRDNTEDVGPGTDVDESLYGTIPSSEFTTGSFGLPRFSYSISLAEMLTFVNRTDMDITGGDQFTIRFELILTDGRRFSFDDNTGTLTGSFFSSPFLYTPTVICPVGADQFVGEYSLTVTPDSPLGGVPLWNDQTVTLSVGETSTQRVFEATYIEAAAIGNGPEAFAFEMICGETIALAGQGTGLACSGVDITLGPVGDDVDKGTYDTADDSVITIVFVENEGSACGGGPVVMTATLTKL
ncbi:MAG: hypothetical protein ACX93O_16485 [Flagellimonas sp.]